MILKKYILPIAFYFISFEIKAQDIELNTITTSVPFLEIITNAQSIGSGQVGVVASENYLQNGLDQNPALLTRGKKVLGIQVLNYVPWLTEIADDINLIETGFYQSFGKHAVGFLARKFNLGEIDFTDAAGEIISADKRVEYYLSLKYSYSISEKFSIGCGIKYINSDLTGGKTINNVKTRPAQVLAGDLGFYYRTEILQRDKFKVSWNLGLSILNIGNKVKYSDSDSIGDFIPQDLKLGTLFTFDWKEQAKYRLSLDLAYQASKLLVPSPPQYGNDDQGNILIISGMNPDVSISKGIIQSFYDAPGGAKEEFREIIHQFGAETRFSSLDNKMIGAIRAGYFHQHATKGNRKFLTLGAGFTYNVFRFDIARIIPIHDKSPLKNTYSFNFSILFTADKYPLFKKKRVNAAL